jgi:hypothetical protein
MSGMGLIAAVLMAGPAQASGAAGQTDAKSTLGQADKGSKVKQHRDRDFVAGYFSSERACEREGRRGEFIHKWDDYECDYVRFGFHRGMWQLEAERDGWDGDWRGDRGRGDGWNIGNRGNDHRNGHRDSDRRNNDHNKKNDHKDDRKNDHKDDDKRDGKYRR